MSPLRWLEANVRYVYPAFIGALVIINFCKASRRRRRNMDRYHPIYPLSYYPMNSNRLEAEEKAKKLFISLLTPEQKKELEQERRVTVKGGTTNTLYQIGIGVAGNIRQKHGNKLYCCHMNLSCHVPTWDHMAAQLLHLKYNEKDFLNRAYSSIWRY